MKKKFIIRIIGCLILAISAFAVCAAGFEYSNVISIILYILAYCTIGLDIVIEAIENIFKGEIFDENFLMCVATIGALIIKEFPEAERPYEKLEIMRRKKFK